MKNFIFCVACTKPNNARIPLYTHAELYLGRITYGKRVVAQNEKPPNRELQNFFKISKWLVSLHKTKVKQMTPQGNA